MMKILPGFVLAYIIVAWAAPVPMVIYFPAFQEWTNNESDRSHPAGLHDHESRRLP
jgi:hypothetical protein